MYRTLETDINEYRVRDAIRRHGEITRGALGEELSLSAASISRIVRRLVDAGIVSEIAQVPEGPGRTSDGIRFNPRAGCVIAVDLGGTKCHGALADLEAEILAEDFRPTRESADAVTTLLATVGDLRARAVEMQLPIKAVVIGIPAVPDPQTGRVSAGPNVDWHDYDLVERLSPHVLEPWRVENDVTLAAIGQAWRGEGRAVSGFITLSIGTGIGAAIFADGQILRGRHNAAGEIGYLMTSRAQFSDEGGPTASLESVASGPAIERRARELIAEGRETTLDPSGPTAAQVFRAAQAGDAAAGEVVGELVDHVAMTVVDLTAILDPERIILDGSVGRALEPYAHRIARRIGTQLPHSPELRFSRLGPNATVIGAIAGALALDRESEARQALGDMGVAGVRTFASLPAYGQLASDTARGA